MIIIIGPTGTGKTHLANYISAHLKNSLIVNLDSIQIYKELNSLTNKPMLEKQENEEWFTMKTNSHDYEIVKKVISENNLMIYKVKERKLILQKKLETLKELKSYFLLAPNRKNKTKNYLFNSKSIYEENIFSIYDYLKEFNKIKFNNKKSEIIAVGGTIYYAYHLIKGTEFCHSKDYFKPYTLLKNFDLICITPKSKDQYKNKLKKAVRERFNKDSYQEILNLTQKFKDIKTINKLSKLSYEYKWFIRLFKIINDREISSEKLTNKLKNELLTNKSIREIIDYTYLAEKNYAKRQMTFIRKIERELIFDRFNYNSN